MLLKSQNISTTLLASVFVVNCLTSFDASGQGSSGSAPNLIANGGFESSYKRENLWNGVDRAGYLTGERGTLPVLARASSIAIAENSMPMSVSLADMNNSGLLDIVTMDVLGYLRIYFNSGTAEEPKFEMGDLAGVFLSRTSPEDPITAGTERTFVRRGTRVHATKMFRSGKYDLLIGNYAGEVMALMNSGSNTFPDFKQPSDIGRITIPTSKDQTTLWGNVFAPATWDWDGDGRDDILIGEGSYSANNIHLLLNKGSGGRPAFEESNRHVLAFGDGLEQLSPAVVDYNGNGKPDLLVAERTGKIAVYLNKGDSIRDGEPVPELEFASFINSTKGTALSFGGISTVTTGDLNGDGLFDLVVGKSNGRIAIAYNSGTKEEPKFEAPVDIKGTPSTSVMNVPSGWDVDYGLKRGNFLAYISVVSEADDSNLNPAEGKSALKIGYEPSHNKILPAPSEYLPALGDFLDKTIGADEVNLDAETLLSNAPARYFMLRQQGGRMRLKVGASYTFSMKVRGRASEGLIRIVYWGKKELSQARITRGGRDSATVERNIAREAKHENLSFSPGPSWTEVSRTFRVGFNNSDLKDLPMTTSTTLLISFTLPQGAELYIDDISLVER